MERSFLKGLINASSPSEVQELVKLLPPPSGGPHGWMREWARCARALRDKDLQAAVAAAKEEKAAASAAALAARQAEPVWGVVPEYGAYSFSNELYGFKAVEGKGSLTYEEAVVEAEKKRFANSRRIKAAAEYWDAYLNG